MPKVVLRGDSVEIMVIVSIICMDVRMQVQVVMARWGRRYREQMHYIVVVNSPLSLNKDSIFEAKHAFVFISPLLKLHMTLL